MPPKTLLLGLAAFSYMACGVVLDESEA